MGPWVRIPSRLRVRVPAWAKISKSKDCAESLRHIHVRGCGVSASCHARRHSSCGLQVVFKLFKSSSSCSSCIQVVQVVFKSSSSCFKLFKLYSSCFKLYSSCQSSRSAAVSRATAVMSAGRLRRAPTKKSCPPGRGTLGGPGSQLV